MRFTVLAVCSTLGIAACVRTPQPAAPAVNPTPAMVLATPADPSAMGAHTITERDMRARIGYLASDALKGRDTPSQGLETAAAYIASEFERMGLEPGGDAGTFFQRYPFPVLQLDTMAAAFSVQRGSQRTRLAYGRDFIIARGTPESVSASLHFVGVADSSMKSFPEGVNDGIAAVSMSGAPDRAWRASASRMQRLAQGAGAKALVILVDDAWTPAVFATRNRAFTTAQGALGGLRNIPVYYVRQTSARPLFRSAGQDLAALSASGGVREPVTLSGSTFALEGKVKVIRDANPPNVIGILRGSDPALRDTYVVLSAHMDHVGVRMPNASGDSVFNGADDDASGTSAVVEVAEALASMTARPARSVLFITVSGEEKGLLGSEYFADHPTVPIDKMVANINMDMIGRNAPDSIVVIGQQYSSLGPLLQEVGARHPELRLTLSQDIWPEERFFFRSDHYNFAKKDIPAIFFFNGVHADYHQPSDEISKINADKAARVAQLAFHMTWAIANGRTAPQWSPQGLAEVRALMR